MKITLALTKMLFPDTILSEEQIKILSDSAERFDLKCIPYYGEYFQDEEYNLNRGGDLSNEPWADMRVRMFSELHNK